MKREISIFCNALWLIAVSSFISLFSSCSSMHPLDEKNSSLTQGNVEMNLHTGITTKAEALEKLGSPNVVTRDGQGRELWTYQRATQTSRGNRFSDLGTLLLIGQSRDQYGFENSSTMITLIIKFNNHDVIEDINSRTSHF